jgi:serine/threonine-protein kinase RsbW
MGPPTSVSLVVPSQIRLVDLVHAASEKMAEVAGFEADEALNVGLAVRETVVNAITHGNKGDPERSVTIRLEADDNGLRVTIQDQGDGFDPDAMPDPTAGDNLLQTSGRGILLCRAFVDDLKFRFLKGKGMEVTLTKNRSPEE